MCFHADADAAADVLGVGFTVTLRKRHVYPHFLCTHLTNLDYRCFFTTLHVKFSNSEFFYYKKEEKFILKIISKYTLVIYF